MARQILGGHTDGKSASFEVLAHVAGHGGCYHPRAYCQAPMEGGPHRLQISVHLYDQQHLRYLSSRNTGKKNVGVERGKVTWSHPLHLPYCCLNEGSSLGPSCTPEVQAPHL